LIGLGVLVQALSLACGHDVSGPLGMLGTPKILLAIDGFGLILVSIGRWDFHPLSTFFFLLLFAFLGPIFAIAFLTSLLFRPLLLPP